MLYLYKKLEIFANGKEIEIGVKTEDVYATAGATGVEDNGVSVVGGCGSEDFGGDLAVGEGVILEGRRGRAWGHYIENEGDEEQRDCDDEKNPSVSVDLVGERRATSGGSLEHLVGFKGMVMVVLIGGRGIGLAVDEFGGGRRPVADLTVEVEGLLVFL